jgi:hypothetical protein
MQIIIKQNVTASCHFLCVRSNYIHYQPILEYLQPVFVRQHRRTIYTSICNTRLNHSSLIKRSTKQYIENTYLVIEDKKLK